MPADEITNVNQEEAQPEPEMEESAESRSFFSRRIIIPVALGVLLAGVIALSLRLKTQSSQLREELQKLESAGIRIGDMENNIARQLRQINELENKLKDTSTQRDSLQATVTDLKTDQARLQTELANSQKSQQVLEERLKAEENTVAQLQKKLDQERADLKLTFSKIDRLRDEKESLQLKIARLEQERVAPSAVTMPELVVKQEYSFPNSLNGTILAVNRRYDFVVFNLGENDGVKAGDCFFVLDNEEKVGEVTARRILPSMTVADIIPEQTHCRLKKNFTVILNE